MKRFIIALTAVLLCAAGLYAQTPEEILEKMNKVMDRGETEGMAMTMTMKIPILGSMPTRMYTVGGKSKAEMTAMGHTLLVWEEAGTTWTYDQDKNELTIDYDAPAASSDAEEGLGLLGDVDDGYDVKLQKETADAWLIVCKKNKTNTDKDAPKKIEVSVYKDSYMLKEMKAGMKGVTMILSDVEFGVDEKDVTFDMSKFQNATIVDKRVKEEETKQ